MLRQNIAFYKVCTGYLGKYDEISRKNTINSKEESKERKWKKISKKSRICIVLLPKKIMLHINQYHTSQDLEEGIDFSAEEKESACKEKETK